MGNQAERWFWTLVLAATILQAQAAAAQISALPDADIEQCLNEGEIGKRAGKLVGLTKPEHLEIDCSVDIDSAVFKYLDESRRGITHLPGGSTEMNFSDSYRYERVAYLLDRELGLNMVPVAVTRNIKGEEGALVAWIPNAAHQFEIKEPPTGPQMAALAQQKAIMRLFDALILNIDRRKENWMVDKDTWKLYLIDHSRAFRDRKELPEEFTKQLVRLNQDLYTNLEALDEADLTELCEGLITGAQIKFLLARRDLILQKIDQDREDYGDAIVFLDWQGSEGDSQP